MISTQQIGIMGMAVMGANLAINIANHGYRVSVFNRSHNKTNQLITNYPSKKIIPFYTIENFIRSLERPRLILLMIESGINVDLIISSIKPFLTKGDVIIDGGNSFFKDTIKRNQKLFSEGFYFIGAGFSGGEYGALHGPSIMPGGQREAYELIKPIFTNIAAIAKDGEPCITYIGPNGAGHYLKMIHNGIEYGNMQLIAETYSILKIGLCISNEEMSSIFTEWNLGELNSYLIEITKNIFTKKDQLGNYLIDFILDKAESKGTGKWVSQSALELGVPSSLITESVFARYMSSIKEQRVIASNLLAGPEIKIINNNKLKFIETIRRALYFGIVISYTQGFLQLHTADVKYNWNLNYTKIANIFRAGCIIRSKLLEVISNIYNEKENVSNLLLEPYFKMITDKYHQSIRDIVTYSIQNGIPVPAFSSAVVYYDSYRSKTLPANLIQAQRDYFGSHKYERIDISGVFHTQWTD